MAVKNTFYSISIYVLVFMSSACSVYAAQQHPANVQDDEDNRWWRELDRQFNRSTMGGPLQRIKELKEIPAAIDKIDNQIRALDARIVGRPRPAGDPSLEEQEEVRQLRKQLNAWADAKGDLLDILKADNKYGRAIAFGLAGNDARLLKDMRVENLAEGAKLGLSLCASRVLSERIKNSVDRVLGGTWDAFISTIVESWNTLCEVLFHGSGEPFNPKQIKGWQDLIKASFEDISRLLKDGLKDSLRGHDMTLRHIQGDDEAVEEEAVTINAWKILASGYVRQFNYVVSQLDKHLVYYSQDEMIGFYVREIKQQLLETNKLLEHGGSLKELDAAIDSNKTLIPALQKNILNLFTRLSELVEPPVSSSRLTNNTSSSMDGSRKGMGRSGYDDDGVPRSFRSGGY